MRIVEGILLFAAVIVEISVFVLLFGKHSNSHLINGWTFLILRETGLVLFNINLQHMFLVRMEIIDTMSVPLIKIGLKVKFSIHSS